MPREMFETFGLEALIVNDFEAIAFSFRLWFG